MKRRDFIRSVLAASLAALSPVAALDARQEPARRKAPEAFLGKLLPVAEKLSPSLSLLASSKTPIAGNAGFILALLVSPEKGFSAGDRIAMQLPRLQQYRPWTPPQWSEPGGPGYTSFFLDGSELPKSLLALVGHRPSPSGYGRLVFTFNEESAKAKNFLLIFGDFSMGSPGSRCQDVAVDEKAMGASFFLFRLESAAGPLVKGEFRLSVLPGKPVCMDLAAALDRSRDPLEVGLRAVFRDRFGNNVETRGARLRWPGLRDDGGWVSAGESLFLRVQRSKGNPGVFRILARDEKTGLGGRSNALTEAPFFPEGFQTFYGDLHVHCAEISDDAILSSAALFQRAREEGLDFMAVTDHAENYEPEAWKACLAATAAFNRPGEFVTFPGFEWTRKASYGHRTVLFRDTPTPAPISSRPVKSHPPVAETPDELWKLLENQEALTTPHNPRPTMDQEKRMIMGQMGSEFGESGRKALETLLDQSLFPKHHQADWSFHNERFQRLVEITSRWSDFKKEKSFMEIQQSLEDIENRPNGVRDALAAGQALGIIGSSDNHSGRPGDGGIACVLAREKTRGALWEALVNRRVFAATRPGMLLDFRVNGRLMGEEIQAAGPVSISLSFSGTAPVEDLEIVKMTDSGFQTAFRDLPYREDLSLNLKGLPFAEESALYYARIRQVDGARAWSSPVFVTRAKP